jgi:hypothetical protein
MTKQISPETKLTLEKIARDMYPEFATFSDDDKITAMLLAGIAVKGLIKHWKPSYDIKNFFDRAEVSIELVKEAFVMFEQDIDRLI